MVEFGLIVRDGGNLRATERGKLFLSDQGEALREVLKSVGLYAATLEWVHYGKRAETTAAEVGQYWESSHADTLGGLKGSTLKDGAVTFGRIAAGGDLGTFLVGRAGKETRTTFDLAAFDAFLNNSTAASSNPQPDATEAPTAQEDTNAKRAEVITPGKAGAGDAPATPPTVTVATSPSVHVNLEIHIAADATADTVREIFRNMARYVLDKPVSDDGE